MELNDIVLSINHIVLGWPLLIYIASIAIAATCALGFVQFRHFLTGIKLVFSQKGEKTTGDMNPFQAFINVLSASLGNGSIAGIATAVYAGGPGAAFWIFVFGFFSMALRFSEVFLSNYFAPIKEEGSTIGGPMIYLQRVIGGKFISYAYAFFLLYLGLASGSAMQANSIRIGFVRILGITPMIIALALLAFITYVMAGGAKRIVAVSEFIVPVKVGVFFISSFIVILYHYQSFFSAFKLMIAGAFYPHALLGGAAGHLVQSAILYGVMRSANATEAGIGTAGVLFGGTGSREPLKNGLMGMISVFISNMVCFLVALMIIVSGVWKSGQTSLDLTISAYETVFGVFGGWIVTFLSVAFGMGVLVTYGYITRACWLFLTNGRFELLFKVIFCLVTFLGALAHVEVVWNLIDLSIAGLLITNLFGVAYFLPEMRSILKKTS
jgi:AGCS family alanine or glycine:cation symporter